MSRRIAGAWKTFKYNWAFRWTRWMHALYEMGTPDE